MILKAYMFAVVFLGFGSVTYAQANPECPPGPFECVDWDDPPVVGGPLPPPPPFFEVNANFIEAQNFVGYLARGNGLTLQITEESLPESVRQIIGNHLEAMDPNKLYVLPNAIIGNGSENGYILFNGPKLE